MEPRTSVVDHVAEIKMVQEKIYSDSPLSVFLSYINKYIVIVNLINFHFFLTML